MFCDGYGRPIKRCKCGNDLPYLSKKEFCSKECHETYGNVNSEVVVGMVKCKGCDTHISALSKKSFCSIECGRRYYADSLSIKTNDTIDGSCEGVVAGDLGISEKFIGDVKLFSPAESIGLDLVEENVIALRCNWCDGILSGKRKKFCSDDCREKYFKKQYDERMERTLFRIFNRDGFRCVYCGGSSILDNVKLVVDHVFPIHLGGENELYNLVTSCSSCNASKLNRLMSRRIIFEIWNRNSQLNLSFLEDDYKGMVKDFNLIYAGRLEKK